MRLSPTAESFTPAAADMGAGISNGSPDRPLQSRYRCYPGPNARLNIGPSKHHTYRTQSSRLMGTIHPSIATAERLELDIRSRAFVIENVPGNLSYMALAGFFNVSPFVFAPWMRCKKKKKKTKKKKNKK